MNEEQAIAKLEKMVEQLKEIIELSGNFQGNWEEINKNLQAGIVNIEKSIEDYDPDYEEYPYELD